MSPKLGYLFRLFWVVIFLSMGNSFAISAEYFVSPVGLDTSTGSLSSPFKTIRKGLSILRTGDILTVEEGTYTDPIDEPVGLDNSLAKDWNNTITIRARPGKTVILRPSSGDRVFTFQRSKQSYVILDGFIIDASQVAIDAIKITRTDSDVCHHVWIRNCVIKNGPDQGILMTQESATSEGGSNRLTNLDVFDNGFKCSMNSFKFCHGIYVASNNNTIENSKIHDNAGWGVHVYSGSYEIKNNVVRNNLVYRNGSHGVNGNLGLSNPTSGNGYPGIGLYSGVGHEAYGNVVWENISGIVLRYGGEQSIVHDNTLYSNHVIDGFPIDVNGVNTDDSNPNDSVFFNRFSTSAAPTTTLSMPMDFYVSPDGKATGDGSISSPWDFQTALNQPASVKPGATIWLRGGTYLGFPQLNIGKTLSPKLFTSRLKGTIDQPIFVRQYVGERATIDAAMESLGEWVTFMGFEIMNSDPQTTTCPTERPGGLNLYGRGNSAINLIVHDSGHPGIGFWNPVDDGGRLYGNILWNNGVYDTCTSPGTPEKPWLRGSAFYMQNTYGTRYVKDNITFWHFTTGMKAYGSTTSGFWFDGNVVFSNGMYNMEVIPNGDNKVNPEYAITKRLKMTNNCTYRNSDDSRSGVQIGLFSEIYGVGVEAEVLDNYFVNPDMKDWPNAKKEYPGAIFNLQDFSDIKVTGNSFIGSFMEWDKTPRLNTITWNNNSYFSERFKHPSWPFVLLDAKGDSGVSTSTYQGLTFSQWQVAARVDANSTFKIGFPTTNKVFVKKNIYEPGRSTVVIYNWEKLGSVSVDVSSALQIGDEYEIRDVQNYYGTPVLSGVYAGGALNFPMNLTQITPLIGINHDIPVHSDNGFGVFIIHRMKSSQAVAEKHSIQATSSSHGTIFPSGSIEVIHGGNFTFTVQPDEGYAVKSIKVDGSTVPLSSNQYSFVNVSQSHTISVEFSVVTVPPTPSNPPVDLPAQSSGSSILFDELISINNVISENKKEIQFDFTLSSPAQVVASLYSSRGELLEELKNEHLSSGQLSSIIWNGTLKSGKAVSSGVYILKVKLGDHEEMKKIVVVK